ncbi:motility protein A [Candidatus Villigracilis saccharophilus]|uniref:motility protein A n=1 Tax=Candidatus Villigracilis saccharophilus TaxID=3140684 RepID=UPI003134D7E5|nr:motility protein A [Anaerolineales bacterium]
MDIATIAGLILSLTAIITALIMDGGTPGELFAHPSAIILIFGGALGATAITAPLKIVLQLPKYIIQAFTTRKFDSRGTIDLLSKLADKARREGLLALEDDSKKIEDKFLQKGISMVVDGIDPEQVSAILETTVAQMRARHKQGMGFFTAAGAFAPTFGIIGTVMGLISVLKQLDNPGALGEAIAAAFLATLWGLLSSNLIFLPIAGKLKAKDEEEAHDRYMQMEGILAIQAGENPRIVRDKLNAYLSPSEAKSEEEAGDKKVPAGNAERAKA